MPERRHSEREERPSPAISSLITSGEEPPLEGVVQDLSDHGVRIAGAATGLTTGEDIDVVLVVQGDQKIRYQCEVRHIDPDGKFYGLAFKSAPEHIREQRDEHMKCCVRCKREYAPEWSFCGICGYELVRA